MPQFDFYSFSVQIFWILISFTFFYFYLFSQSIIYFSELLKFKFKILLKNNS